MKMENCISAIDARIPASLIPTFVLSRYVLPFTAFVVTNLFRSAITGFCPTETFLSRLTLWGK